jgi:hypothetical protein
MRRGGDGLDGRRRWFEWEEAMVIRGGLNRR